MKKIVFLAAAACLALVAQGQTALRLMSYNVRNARGMDNVRNVERTADVIRLERPDVVAVQEVDSMTRRSGGRYVLGEIAEATGMNATFAAAIDFDGGKYGIGLLSKSTPLRVSRFALPGREERRALLVAEFDDYVYCCAHLSLTAEDRLKSMEIIRQATADYDKPVFLAGDFNAEPESEFIAALQNDFTLLCVPDAATFPADAPKRKLDYIAVRKPKGEECVVKEAKVVGGTQASDHLPIVVDVQLGQ